MQRKSLLLLPCLALAGCVVGPSMQSKMAGYIGATPQTLVRTLGVPDKHITVNNVQYFAYTTNYQQPVGYFGTYGAYYYSSYPAAYYCETTFTVKDGRVFGVKLRGDGCG